jgi:hypothetical protein
MAERKKQRRRRKVDLHRDAEGLEKAIITGSGTAEVGWGSFWSGTSKEIE